MEQSIRSGEKIEMRGFGTFQVRSYRAYRGRNPRTGQVVAVRRLNSGGYFQSEAVLKLKLAATISIR
jgi:nucleoid DNA-binding protein